MATSVGDNALRRSALTLHALGEADRCWLLEQLSPERRNALLALLKELRELGMPPDPELVKAALSQSDAAPVDMVAAEEARAMFRCLERQPSELQGMLLATLDQDKRAAVLAHGSFELFAAPAVTEMPHWTEKVRQVVLTSWREAAKVHAAREPLP